MDLTANALLLRFAFMQIQPEGTQFSGQHPPVCNPRAMAHFSPN
jgi:hypothetical protein